MSGGATDGHEENKCMGTMVLFGNALWPQRWERETRWRRCWFAQTLFRRSPKRDVYLFGDEITVPLIYQRQPLP